MAAGISCFHSTAADAAGVAAELADGLPLDSAEFVLLLHGPGHTGSGIAGALGPQVHNRFYGCSTSGEITPTGYHENTVAALCFDRRDFTCVARRIGALQRFEFSQARDLVLSMQWELRERAPEASAGTTFALMLIDSLSQAEEFVAAAVGAELGSIHLVGASAGDNWQLRRTPVLYEGAYHDDSAVLLLVHSRLPFRHYNFHNLVPTARRGVITAASPAERLVHEINGAPAAAEYARLCGIDPGQLGREYLSRYPAIITVGDRAYPRGFLEVMADGSLHCACAIDEGVVFRVPAQLDYLVHLREALGGIGGDLGRELLVLGFECAARRQMVQQLQVDAQVVELFADYNVWGFACMGEQSNSLNMNNSFNCLAFSLAP